jgi:hypothetical protein
LSGDPTVRAIGTAAVALWIFGGAVIFFIRFSVAFYVDNKAAIDGALGL